jgi:hypothetical protein
MVSASNGNQRSDRSIDCSVAAAQVWNANNLIDQLIGIAKINLTSLMEVTALGELPHVEQAFQPKWFVKAVLLRNFILGSFVRHALYDLKTQKELRGSIELSLQFSCDSRISQMLQQVVNRQLLIELLRLLIHI